MSSLGEIPGVFYWKNFANTVQLHLKLNKNTDADILDYLDGLSNKQGFIKTLIRQAIEKGK